MLLRPDALLERISPELPRAFDGVPTDGPARDGSEAVVPPLRKRRGPISALVHVAFRLFEFGIFLALVPVRMVATAVGRLIVTLVQLPFRILGIAARAAGFLLVAAMLVMLGSMAFALIDHGVLGW